MLCYAVIIRYPILEEKICVIALEKFRKNKKKKINETHVFTDFRHYLRVNYSYRARILLLILIIIIHEVMFTGRVIDTCR